MQRDFALRTRLLIMMLTMTFVMAIGVGTWNQKQNQETSLALQRTREQRRTVIRGLQNVEGNEISSFVWETTWWDDMVANIKKPDKTWLKENLDKSLSRLRADGAWLFDRNGRIVHGYSKVPGFSNAPPISSQDLLTYIRPGNPVTRAFTLTPYGLKQMFIEGVHASNDPGHKGKVYGYLVISCDWLRSTQPRLEQLGQNKIKLTVSNLPLREEGVNSFGLMPVNVPLVDISGKLVATATYQVREELAALSLNTLDESVVGATWGYLSILALFLMFTLAWIERPLNLIVSALRLKDVGRLQGVKHTTNETGLLANLVRSFLRQQDDLEKVNEDIQHSNLNLEKKVAERTEELAKAYEATIIGWSRAMDARDQETEGHTQRVAKMAKNLGEAMGLSPKQIQSLYRGALLHDIGKIGISDTILLKQGNLTDEERELMKQHPRMAYEMLQPIEFLHDCLDVPLYHHEKYDGTGYPDGLRGDKIPLMARIFAIADVWDALRSNRPYRRAWGETKTREYIAAQSGTHFDPIVVAAFLKLPPMEHPSDFETEVFDHDLAA